MESIDVFAPLASLQWVDRNTIHANDYNPNKVSEENLKLLIQSILTNGWTLPIVVRPDGTIIDGFHRWTVSGREPLLSLLGGKVPVVVVDHHGDESADVCALNVRQEGDGMAFTLCDRAAGRYEVTIPAMGRHNVANALAAYAAATRLGLAPEGVIAGLADFEQTGMRQKVVHAGGMDVIEDCYNANPDSMKAALAMFREYPCKRRFALLGDMLELGEMSASAHEELGRQAAGAGLTTLVTYGPEAARTAEAAKAAGLADVVHAGDYQQAADALLARMKAGDALLVKASRGMALEKALALFYPVCGK